MSCTTPTSVTLLIDFAKQSPLLWIGFLLTDKKEGELGNIEDVMQTGNQWIAKITYKDTEVLIPLIEQTIDSLNIKTKKIELIDEYFLIGLDYENKKDYVYMKKILFTGY